MKQYITAEQFKTDFGFDAINDQKVEDSRIDYFIKRASWKVDTIVGGAISKGLREGYYKIVQNKLTLDETKFDQSSPVEAANLEEAKDATAAIFEAIGLITKFGIDTGYDFLTGSFSSSIGAESMSESIDFEVSLERLEKTINDMLGIYNFNTILFGVEYEVAYDDTIQEDDVRVGILPGDKRPLTMEMWLNHLTDFEWFKGRAGIHIGYTVPGQPDKGITISQDRNIGFISVPTAQVVFKDQFGRPVDLTAATTKAEVDAVIQEWLIGFNSEGLGWPDNAGIFHTKAENFFTDGNIFAVLAPTDADPNHVVWIQGFPDSTGELQMRVVTLGGDKYILDADKYDDIIFTRTSVIYKVKDMGKRTSPGGYEFKDGEPGMVSIDNKGNVEMWPVSSGGAIHTAGLLSDVDLTKRDVLYLVDDMESATTTGGYTFKPGEKGIVTINSTGDMVMLPLSDNIFQLIEDAKADLAVVEQTANDNFQKIGGLTQDIDDLQKEQGEQDTKIEKNAKDLELAGIVIDSNAKTLKDMADKSDYTALTTQKEVYDKVIKDGLKAGSRVLLDFGTEKAWVRIVELDKVKKEVSYSYLGAWIQDGHKVSSEKVGVAAEASTAALDKGELVIKWAKKYQATEAATEPKDTIRKKEFDVEVDKVAALKAEVDRINGQAIEINEDSFIKAAAELADALKIPLPTGITEKTWEDAITAHVGFDDLFDNNGAWLTTPQAQWAKTNLVDVLTGALNAPTKNSFSFQLWFRGYKADGTLSTSLDRLFGHSTAGVLPKDLMETFLALTEYKVTDDKDDLQAFLDKVDPTKKGFHISNIVKAASQSSATKFSDGTPVHLQAGAAYEIKAIDKWRLDIYKAEQKLQDDLIAANKRAADTAIAANLAKITKHEADGKAADTIRDKKIADLEAKEVVQDTHLGQLDAKNTAQDGLISATDKKAEDNKKALAQLGTNQTANVKKNTDDITKLKNDKMNKNWDNAENSPAVAGKAILHKKDGTPGIEAFDIVDELGKKLDAELKASSAIDGNTKILDILNDFERQLKQLGGQQVLQQMTGTNPPIDIVAKFGQHPALKTVVVYSNTATGKVETYETKEVGGQQTWPQPWTPQKTEVLQDSVALQNMEKEIKRITDVMTKLEGLKKLTTIELTDNQEAGDFGGVHLMRKAVLSTNGLQNVVPGVATSWYHPAPITVNAVKYDAVGTTYMDANGNAIVAPVAGKTTMAKIPFMQIDLTKYSSDLFSPDFTIRNAWTASATIPIKYEAPEELEAAINKMVTKGAGYITVNGKQIGFEVMNDTTWKGAYNISTLRTAGIGTPGAKIIVPSTDIKKGGGYGYASIEMERDDAAHPDLVNIYYIFKSNEAARFNFLIKEGKADIPTTAVGKGIQTAIDAAIKGLNLANDYAKLDASNYAGTALEAAITAQINKEAPAPKAATMSSVDSSVVITDLNGKIDFSVPVVGAAEADNKAGANVEITVDNVDPTKAKISAKLSVAEEKVITDVVAQAAQNKADLTVRVDQTTYDADQLLQDTKIKQNGDDIVTMKVTDSTHKRLIDKLELVL